jgi:hypothetical protein
LRLGACAAGSRNRREAVGEIRAGG